MSEPRFTNKTLLAAAVAGLVLLPSPLLAATNKPQFLPPIAPSLDTSVNGKQSGDPSPNQDVAPAPAPARSSSGGYAAAGAAATNDRDSQNAQPVKDLMQQALLSHNRGDYVGAELLFRRVLSIDPHNVDANFNLGAMSEDKGDLNAALYYYQTAARLNPGDSDLPDAVSSIKSKMQQQQIAQQTTSRLQQKQRLRAIAQDAASAYKAGQYDRAIADLQEVLRNDPNDPNALFGLAQAYRGKKDFNAARRYLTQAIAIAPDNQLYQATLRDLDHETKAGGTGAGAGSALQVADGPQPAPDFRSVGGAPIPGGQDSGTNWQSMPTPAGDPSPSGQLTAFTDQGENQLQGHASRSYGGMGGLGMAGMGMGAGLLTAGLSSMFSPPGSYYGGTGTRLMRGALVGSLAGATIGGLMNMNGPGGFNSGAMRGGMTGGLMGLMRGF